jgi:superfamily II DNA or RNA helicase
MLEEGLYELLVTNAVDDLLATKGPDFLVEDLDPAESASIIAAHLREVLESVLRSVPKSEQPLGQIELANRILQQTLNSPNVLAETLLASPGRILRQVSLNPGVPTTRPITPLSESSLLINAPREPKLASELKAELESADRVDLLCAFVVWTGVRVLREPLERLANRNVPFRVITTTYMGATESRALEVLEELGAEIKVSYETRTTRLHAKAWLFERNTGYSTAYIGSSNLSYAALHEGLEWNVRISQSSAPTLMDRFRAAFETYWAEERFEKYESERFRKAIDQVTATHNVDHTLFDIRPYPYQEQMLYQLAVERERHDRWRNLVVAATGTGKTILAALDYKRLAGQFKGARLLFVAHRKEILQQSLSTFRHVMGDGAFGELYVGGERPEEWRHVFASIQSLSGEVIAALDPDAFDVVIVDEFHHAAAPSYDRLLERLQPKVLLGLTATPERADGRDVTGWFDGHIAVDLRLWDAIDEGLLCPFQYFGVSDEVDLSQLQWKRGGYDISQLSDVYTGNDARVSKVLRAIRDTVEQPLAMRALGFCVSVKHAEFMADRFTKAGIPSLAVSGTSHPDERDSALRRLKAGDLNILFAVDLYNEGVDVPEIDTVLFLRPTESVTVFLQQLGRGLRKTSSKTGLTVLDFIGQQHRRFRFDLRFRALTGATRKDLERQIDEGFPFLPSGCHIQLDRVARQRVLSNVREAISTSKKALIEELRSLGDIDLPTFLSAAGLELTDVYRNNGSWTKLRRDAGLPTPGAGPKENHLLRRMPRILHVDDPERLGVLQNLVAGGTPILDGPRSERLATLIHYDIWGEPMASLQESARALREHPAVLTELTQIINVLDERAEHLTPQLDSDDIPLRIHAQYSRDEILAAVGQSTVDKPAQLREGVRWDEENQVDLFFVTLNKAEKDYSPTTMYRDYAISPTLFHWESQSTTSEGSPTGQRYIHHQERGSSIFLFARLSSKTPLGAGSYLFLGPASYMSHVGERPMAITWRLEHPLPPDFFQTARSVA